jgi:hypothetical protein
MSAEAAEETGSNLVQWGSYELEVAEGEQEQLERASAGQFAKFEQGKNRLRFLPPKIGVKTPFVMVHQHFVKLPGMEKPVSFNCPRLHKKGICPVCQKVDALRGSGKAADYALAGEVMAKLRVYGNAVNRKNPELGPQIYAFGKTVHEPLVSLRTDEDAGGDYTHPYDGFDIIVERKGDGKMGTEYSVRAAREKSPLGDMSWIEQQADLSRLAQCPTAEEILERLSGATGGGGGGSRGAPAASAGSRLGAAPTGARTSGGTRAAPGRTAESDVFGGKAGAAADDDD